MSGALDATLLEFELGYVMVLAVPGPNIIAIAGLAALRGFRATVPICMGIASGATLLAALLHGVLAAAHSLRLQGQLQVAGAVLLVTVAVQVAWQRIDGASPKRPRTTAAAQFASGFFTAVAANPLSGTFFGAQFAGPLAEHGTADAALVCVPCTALIVSLGVAALLSRPVLRRTTVLWQRPLRLATATVLTLVAAEMLFAAWE